MEDDYPYVTVVSERGLFVPVLWAWTEAGFPQISDKGGEHEEYIDAKREGVEMADYHHCPYLVPIL